MARVASGVRAAQGELRAVVGDSRPARSDPVGAKRLVRERSSQVNRVCEILELANVKLGSVVSNVMGVTGRAILDAMIAGEDDPDVLAGLARGSLRGKRRELAEAVPGLMRDHHRFLLRRHLDLIDELERRIDRIGARIVAETTGPSQRSWTFWRAFRRSGGDRPRRFWRRSAMTCRAFRPPRTSRPGPGLRQSRERREAQLRVHREGGTRGGGTHLSQEAWAAARTKGGYYWALYYRRRARGGPKRAVVAVQLGSRKAHDEYVRLLLGPCPVVVLERPTPPAPVLPPLDLEQTR